MLWLVSWLPGCPEIAPRSETTVLKSDLFQFWMATFFVNWWTVLLPELLKSLASSVSLERHHVCSRLLFPVLLVVVVVVVVVAVGGGGGGVIGVLPRIGVLLPLPSLIQLYSLNLCPGYEVALKPGGAHLRRVADLGLKFDSVLIFTTIHHLHTHVLYWIKYTYVIHCNTMKYINMQIYHVVSNL